MYLSRTCNSMNFQTNGCVIRKLRTRGANSLSIQFTAMLHTIDAYKSQRNIVHESTELSQSHRKLHRTENTSTRHVFVCAAVRQKYISARTSSMSPCSSHDVRDSHRPPIPHKPSAQHAELAAVSQRACMFVRLKGAHRLCIAHHSHASAFRSLRTCVCVHSSSILAQAG